MNTVLRLAVPAVLTNLAVPLLGLIDMAIVGHMGSETYIGAIAVGTMLFNLIYWLFGFLRMSTGGFTSQALGRRDQNEIAYTLLRATCIALAGALLLWLLQWPLSRLGLLLIGSSDIVNSLALRYFHILLWGAPAVLCLYGLNGWFLGMQNSRYPMYITVFQSLANIALSLLFVIVMGMHMEGVALGTLISQYLGLGLALVLWHRTYGHHFGGGQTAGLLLRCFWNDNRRLDTWQPLFRVNGDLFLRTLCLVMVTLYFTHVGAQQGDTMLAVNALLMQLFTLYSYFMDGFAYAGEALTGLSIGSHDAVLLKTSLRNVFLQGLVVTIVFTLAYGVFGGALLRLLTDDTHVLRTAGSYLPWAACIPFCGMAAFLWDGIYAGATDSRSMLVSLLVGTCVFFCVFLLTRSHIGNHGLWLAFLLYLLTRGAVLSIRWSSRKHLTP